MNVKIFLLSFFCAGLWVVNSTVEAKSVRLVGAQSGGSQALWIDRVKVNTARDERFIFITLSKILDRDCGAGNIGFVQSDDLLSEMNEAKDDEVPVAVELSPQPCKTIGNTNYLSIESIEFLKKSAVKKDRVSKPLPKKTRNR